MIVQHTYIMVIKLLSWFSQQLYVIWWPNRHCSCLVLQWWLLWHISWSWPSKPHASSRDHKRKQSAQEIFQRMIYCEVKLIVSSVIIITQSYYLISKCWSNGIITCDMINDHIFIEFLVITCIMSLVNSWQLVHFQEWLYVSCQTLVMDL